MYVHLTLEIPHSLGFLLLFMKLSFSYSWSYWSAPGFWPQTFSLPMKVKVKSISHVRLFAAPWTVVYQAPLSMGFSRQEYWSGLLFPSPGDLPDPGIKPGSSYIAGRCFTVWAIREVPYLFLYSYPIKGWQTTSIKDQIVNIFDFVGHMISCNYSRSHRQYKKECWIDCHDCYMYSVHIMSLILQNKQYLSTWYFSIVVVQSLSHVWLFTTSWTAAHQASLSFTVSQSLLTPMSIELVIPSNHLVLCHPLLLLLFYLSQDQGLF